MNENHRREETSCCDGNGRIKVQIGGGNRILKATVPIERRSNSSSSCKTVELIGRSWAADCTAFVVPSLDLALDAGYPVYGKRLNNVFVTHVHTDHVHHITHLKSRSKPPNFYLPRESVDNTRRFIQVAQQVTSHITQEEYDEFDWETSYRFHGVSAGDRIVVNSKRGIVCHVVHCDHTIPCVGYIFSQLKSSLIPEYRGLPGPEIGRLRKQGINVTTEVEQDLFCFLGDTSTQIFEDGSPDKERILSCPTVIVECTFLTDDCADNASRTKHVLWSKLRPHVEANPQTTFVVTHFSRRWSTTEVAALLQDAPPNVVPWIPTDTGLYCRPIGEEPQVEEIYNHS